MVTDALFGARSEPKDPEKLPQGFFWRPRFFDGTIWFSDDSEGDLIGSLELHERHRMDEDGFDEHGNGFDVERNALRSEELDEEHVEEFTMTDADSMSKDALLGAGKLTSRLLKESRTLMQTRCQKIRSSERGEWRQVC